MTHPVNVVVKSPRWKILLRPYCKTVRAAALCALAPKENFELTVVLADDAFVRELNHTYRGKNQPTNVLSFANEAPPAKGEEIYLGDVVLALETIEREAQAQGKSFKAHATHLIVHGVLHLLGHDHMRRNEAKTMEGLEVKILKKLKVKNPYL
jgi:probable rRNA maturation factor